MAAGGRGEGGWVGRAGAALWCGVVSIRPL